MRLTAEKSQHIIDGSAVEQIDSFWSLIRRVRRQHDLLAFENGMVSRQRLLRKYVETRSPQMARIQTGAQSVDIEHVTARAVMNKKQKNKNKGPGLEEQVETEMSPNVERAVKNVGAMTREEQREFAAYMFGLTQPEKK